MLCYLNNNLTTPPKTIQFLLKIKMPKEYQVMKLKEFSFANIKKGSRQIAIGIPIGAAWCVKGQIYFFWKRSIEKEEK